MIDRQQDRICVTPFSRLHWLVEWLAVVLNALYTLLYLNNNRWCFLFGVAGPLVLAYLCFHRRIYADAALQFIYVGLSIYGFLNVGSDWQVITLDGFTHIWVLALTAAATLSADVLMRRYTDNAAPLLDAFCATFALTGTVLMMLPVHENWLYFIAANGASAVLYGRRRLYVTAGLFVLYWLMAMDGFFQWGLFTFA
jgi:nicotinamide mononucleotide transporter